MNINFKRHLIISGSIILGSLIAATIGVYLLSGDINSSVQGIVTAKSQINTQASNLAVLANLQSETAQADTYQAAMNQLLPTQDGLISFQQWLNSIAASNQVAASVTFQGNPSMPSGNAAGQLGFSFSAEGSVDNIVSFLNDIESKQSGFLFQLNGFDLIDQNGTYQVTSQGNLFFR